MSFSDRSVVVGAVDEQLASTSDASSAVGAIPGAPPSLDPEERRRLWDQINIIHICRENALRLARCVMLTETGEADDAGRLSQEPVDGAQIRR
jgi:hypothetical protein